MRSQSLVRSIIFGALLGGAGGVVDAAVPASMEVHAIVDRKDGKPAELRVDDGGVLRSGDRLQVRVRAPRDGYIYVIAYGSSGSALLLHPFSGRAADARVGADQEMAVPAPGIYLPLDGRPGQESLFAIWSESPLQGVSSLLVRMEGAGGDPVRAEQILREVFPEVRRVSFRHLDKTPLYGVDMVSTGMAMQYKATGTIAPLQESGPTVLERRTDPYAITSTVPEPTQGRGAGAPQPAIADPLLQPSGVPLSSAGQDLDLLLPLPAEENVLGGEGSKLRAFEAGTSQRAVPAAATQVPSTPVQFIGPGAPQSSTEPASVNPPESPPQQPERTSSNTAGGGLTAAIAGLFGLDSAPKEPDTRVVEPPRAGSSDVPTDASAARTLPLTWNEATAANESPSPNAAPALSLRPAASESTSEAARVPERVETTSVAASSSEAPAPQPPGPAMPASSEKPTAAVVVPSEVTVSPSSVKDAGSDPPPGMEGAVVQAPDPSEFTVSHASKPEPEPQRSNRAAPDAHAEPGSTVEPSEPPREGLFGALSSLFSAESADATPAKVSESKVTPVEAPVVVSTIESPVERETQPPAAVSEIEVATSEPIPVVSSAAAPTVSPAAAVTESEEATPTIAATSPVADDSSTTSGGTLLGALGALFSSPSERSGTRRDTGPTSSASTESTPVVAAVEPAKVTTTPPAASAQNASPPTPAPAPPPVVVVSPPTGNLPDVAAEQPATSEKTEGGGGLFGSIGSLFGFGSSGTAEADSTAVESRTAPPVSVTAAPPPPPVQASPSPPAATLRPAVNLDEGVVVRIPGTEVPRRPGDDVLTEQGNRIRALLGEDVSEATAASQSTSAQSVRPPEPIPPPAPTAPAPSVVARAPPVVETPPEAARQPVLTTPAVAKSDAAAPVIAPAPTLTAAVAAPQSSVSVAPPVPGLGNAPGGLSSAAPSLLPTLSTEQSITAARNVARGVVLVVTPEGSGSGAVVDNSGHVLTNWHLVGDYNAVTVLVKDATGDLPVEGRPIRARVVRFSKFADLALLEMDSVPESVVPLALGDSSQLREGSMLHAIGHPDGGTWAHTPVIVTRVKGGDSWYSGRSFLHKADLVRGQSHTDPGANGAALLDSEMRLVAMSAQATRRGDKVQAVSVETIRDFLSGTSAGLASGG